MRVFGNVSTVDEHHQVSLQEFGLTSTCLQTTEGQLKTYVHTFSVYFSKDTISHYQSPSSSCQKDDQNQVFRIGNITARLQPKTDAFLTKWSPVISYLFNRKTFGSFFSPHLKQHSVTFFYKNKKLRIILKLKFLVTE